MKKETRNLIETIRKTIRNESGWTEDLQKNHQDHSTIKISSD